jgi:hypothetical protein
MAELSLYLLVLQSFNVVRVLQHDLPARDCVSLVSRVVVGKAVEDLVDSDEFKGVFVCHSAHHARLQVIVIHDLLASSHALNTAIYLETQLWKVLPQPVHSLVDEGRNRAVLGRV